MVNRRPSFLVLGFALLIATSTLGCRMEKSFIFFPEKRIFQTPADIGIEYEELMIQTSDGVKINGWFIPSTNSRTTMLWLHGNAGNISHRVDQLRHFHQQLNVNILMVDYREYGRSEGEVSEQGTYQDALSSFDYLSGRPELDSEKIFVFGQSLGAAVAVELAVQRRIFGLILEAPFTSIKDMAKEVLPWLPIGGLLSTKYDNFSKIGQIETPVLILHGDQDSTVPYSHGQRLFEAAPQPKTFYTINGAGHNDTYIIGGPAYFETIARFINGQSL